MTTYRDLERIASYGLPGGEVLLAVIEADLIARGRIAAPAGLVETPQGHVLTLANAITVAGYAATLGWLRTGNVPLAILGLLADEFDGKVARATGTSSELGSALDWGADVASTALILSHMGLAPLAPVALLTQAALRGAGWRPPIGSLRAVLTLAAVAKDAGWARGRWPKW